MKQRIRILPTEVANQIAAGEVVERPASVVRELVENALDAGASSIGVEVRGAGTHYIKVTDNGCGMEPDDALVALERHATSKIRQLEDLFALQSLGFRGEALPSIASVSRLTLTTTADGGQGGVRVEVEGGVIKRVSPASFRQGTSVEVRNIFFNAPARLKFLKSRETELQHIFRTIDHFALAHPSAHLTLTQNGRKIVDDPPHEGTLQRIAWHFGWEMAGALLPFELETGRLSLRGYASSPAVTRAARTHQFLFVNGRCVTDRTVSFAIREAYRTLIPKERYPLVFLYIETDPGLVDVNVHPAKTEVRFGHPSEVRDLVIEAIRRAITGAGENAVSAEVRAERPPARATKEAVPDQPSPAEPTPNLTADREERIEKAVAAYLGEAERRRHQGRGGVAARRRHQKIEPRAAGEPLSVQPTLRLPPADSLRLLGQFQDSFMVLECPEGLLIVDQHAAHERILFERLQEELAASQMPVQQLLFPVSLELSQSERLAAEQHAAELTALGFGLEPFGGKTFLLRSVPAVVADQDCGKLLRDLLDAATEGGRPLGSPELRERALTLMACRAAVKARQPLDAAEIQHLVREMEKVQASASCPHGRPVMVLLPTRELSRWFLRT